MRPLFYKFLVLFLFFTGSFFAQKQSVLKESIDIGTAKFLQIDIENVPLTILPSSDNRIHIDFSMEFKGFSEKEIKNNLSKVKFNKNITLDKIVLSIKSKTTISPAEFISDAPLIISSATSSKSLDNKKRVKKTKKDILESIKSTSSKEGNFMSSILKQIENDENAQVKKSHFFLYIPDYLSLKIIAQRARITSSMPKSENLNLDMNGSFFKARTLIMSNLLLKNASLLVEEIEGGNYTLNNSSNSFIGSVKNAILTLDLSKLEVGEIQENVEIKDFNSELFFYNFSNNFKTFKLNAEYSKIHFYHPESDFSYLAIGNNTVSYFDNITINMQPNKTGKKEKMVARKKKGIGKYAGHIYFDIIHGVIYSHSETYKPVKK
ncbi:hypothetical protein [Aureibaculum conchae]|uniref:hypothetical protein n=1 Tax=Aureibaculum sp. 2308TA14-22 TaxID=3108392 RepID=UPI00339B23E0